MDSDITIFDQNDVSENVNKIYISLETKQNDTQPKYFHKNNENNGDSVVEYQEVTNKRCLESETVFSVDLKPVDTTNIQYSANLDLEKMPPLKSIINSQTQSTKAKDLSKELTSQDLVDKQTTYNNLSTNMATEKALQNGIGIFSDHQTNGFTLTDNVLEWIDGKQQSDMIHCLNVFRKSRKFCDLVLLVGGHEIYCHRVVVAGVSPTIFNELSRDDLESEILVRMPIDSLKTGISPTSVEILINYMYTSKLSFTSEQLMAVYRSSLQLGIERVITICRQHVIEAIDTEQCIRVRRLVQSYGDAEMKNKMDMYIEENFEAVTVGHEFLSLPRIKIEVIASPTSSVSNLLSVSSNDGKVSFTALIWILNVLRQRGPSYFEDLTEQIQRIPLEELNNFAHPSSNLQLMHGGSSDAEGLKLNEDFGRGRPSRSSSMDSHKSNDSSNNLFALNCNLHGEWKVICSMQSIDSNHTISLCCAGDVICTLSIRLPTSLSTNGDGCSSNASSNDLNYRTNNSIFFLPSVSSSSCSSSIGSCFQYCSMDQPRSAAGVAQLDGKIAVAGGFNQSESLDTVECLDTTLNRWSNLPRMNDKRGRFSVAVLNNQLYAVGGSTGSHNLKSVERYDPNQKLWTQLQPLPFGCSEAGVSVLNGILYCVGGVRRNTGIAGLKVCQAYDPSSNSWEFRASLQTARSSLGVASLGGLMYAVAGSDGWKCLNSAEKYDPVTNQWTYTAPLNTYRRGLGLVEHNGSLYCVGGSDGQAFLTSVERHSPCEGDVWTLTSWSLSVPRSNAGLASLNGSIFVVGGFSGRHFLASVEIIEENANDWSSQENLAVKGTAHSSKDDSSCSNNSSNE